MEKVLYVEPYREAGHRNVNASFLAAIAGVSRAVDMVTHEECIRRQQKIANVRAIALPAHFSHHLTGRLAERNCQRRIFNHVADHFPVGEYDAVFLASFDEFALVASRLRGRLFVLAHGNIAGMHNRLKRFAMRAVDRFASIVVFNDYIREGAMQQGLRNVCVEPHGFGLAYQMEPADRSEVLAALCPGLGQGLSSGRLRLVFAPAGAKYGDSFISRLSHDEAFLGMLEAKDIVFVAKGAANTASRRNFVNVNRHLNDREFVALFTGANAIVLSYPQSFEYRVSALLFEAFCHEKPCVISRIPSFLAYRDHFAYDPFFDNDAEFLRKLSEIAGRARGPAEKVYLNREKLVPLMGCLTP